MTEIETNLELLRAAVADFNATDITVTHKCMHYAGCQQETGWEAAAEVRGEWHVTAWPVKTIEQAIRDLVAEIKVSI
jgi:hypothetical protein